MFILRPTRKLISTLFPYTTLFRSVRQRRAAEERKGVLAVFALNGADGLDCFPESLVPIGVTEAGLRADEDRKSTRLNSSHMSISYAVFCLKKKNEFLGMFRKL